MSASLAGSVYGYHAACTFDADAAAAAFRTQRGFASFVRNGAGDYTLTLSDAIAQASACIVATTQAGGNGRADAAWVTATTIRVRTFTAADAAADQDFSLVVLDLGPN